MRGFLRRIFGAPGPVPGSAAAGAAMVPPALPVQGAKSAATETTQPDFVRRETVLDRGEKIAGYEFALLDKLQNRVNRGDAVVRRAYDAALLTRLMQNGAASLLGRRLAFVSLSADSLQSPLLASLPALNTVLMVEVQQPQPDWQELAAQLAALGALGFYIGLTLHQAVPAHAPLAGRVDFYQVDVTRFNGLELRELVSGLRSSPAPRLDRPRLFARNIQSHDDFLFSEKCGFDFFQGPFVASGQGLKVAVSGGINRMVVLPILNMVRADKSFAVIAEQLKNEPTLTYKLLRYLNSPAMGLQMKVESLTDALVLIGREKFYRWMSLLLFDFTNPTYRERMLAERALTRGRTLESLAGEGLLPKAPDMLFLTGLFSLLDVSLNLPMAELLGKAALPEPVSAALLGQPGALADGLQLVSLGEADAAGDPEQLAQALTRCGVDPVRHAQAANAALVWAHEAMGDAE